MAFAEALKRILHLTRDDSELALLADLFRKDSESVQLENGGADPTEKVHIFNAWAAGRVSSVTMVAKSTQAADPNMNSMVLVKNDGLGGGDTTLATYDGTASGFTDDQKSTMTISTATATFNEGDVVSLDYTTNGTGATVIPGMTIPVEYRLD